MIDEIINDSIEEAFLLCCHWYVNEYFDGLYKTKLCLKSLYNSFVSDKYYLIFSMINKDKCILHFSKVKIVYDFVH